MNISTLSSHTGFANAPLTIATMESKYIEVMEPGTPAEQIILLRDAHVTAKSLPGMKFMFDRPTDITDSVKKRGSRRIQSSSAAGRIAYTRGKVVYPDGTHTTKVYLEGCIVQYRQKPDDNYGVTYICLGVPEEYVDAILAGGTSSGVKLQVRENVKKHEGHYWFSANVEDLTADSTKVYIAKPDDDDADEMKIPINDLLKRTEKNAYVDAVVVLSGSQTTRKESDGVDLSGGVFNLSIKVWELFIIDTTHIDGPALVLSDKSKKETPELTDRVVASNALADLLMSKMKIGSSQADA